MKSIDPKSLIIGALLTSTIFLGVGAVDLTRVPKDTGRGGFKLGTERDREWDEDQVWQVRYEPIETIKVANVHRPIGRLTPIGSKPFATITINGLVYIVCRQRIK